jgi:hypothetical protein
MVVTREEITENKGVFLPFGSGDITFPETPW